MTVESTAVRVLGQNQQARYLRSRGVAAQPSEADPRSPGRHDRDRVWYSRALARLTGVTQVLTPDERSAGTHNRYTHSTKVAQVARAIAELLLMRYPEGVERLGGLDADVVDAAGLAHDLGHPPFGHIGEVLLDKYARDELKLQDGYEGNAQTFRIIAVLEPRSARSDGLDLTAATLGAVLKYPWRRDRASSTLPGRPPKFGYYASEASLVEDAGRARAWLQDGYPSDAQTLEAAIMDVADDITYALHDFEDFRAAKLIHVGDVRAELATWNELYSQRLRAGQEPDDERNRFGALRRRLSSSAHYEANEFADAVLAVYNHLAGLDLKGDDYWRVSQETSRRFTSNQISAHLNDLRIEAAPTRELAPVSLSAASWHQVQIFKQITRDFVIARADVAALQRGQQWLLWDLLRRLQRWLEDEDDAARAPAQLRALKDEHDWRGLLDYVAGLTDLGAGVLHGTLTGVGAQTVLAPLSAQ